MGNKVETSQTVGSCHDVEAVRESVSLTLAAPKALITDGDLTLVATSDDFVNACIAPNLFKLLLKLQQINEGNIAAKDIDCQKHI